jgi:hypothetical protein
MSIATLKRKTGTLYQNLSVHSPNGFSLNGGYRNQGYVGQTSFGRALSRTLARGKDPRGHGSRGSFYPVHNILPASTFMDAIENPAVIKRSSLSTKGMLEKRFQWVKRPKPFSSFKVISNPYRDTFSYDQYYAKKKTSIAELIDSPNSPCGTQGDAKCINSLAKCNPDFFRRNGKRSNFLNIYPLYAKPRTKTGASLTSDTVLQKLHQQCHALDSNSALHPLFRVGGRPFAC